MPALPQVLGNASFFQAVMNVLNILTGVGLLSIPFALRQAGWAGLGILWLLGIVTNYTGARHTDLLAMDVHLFPMLQGYACCRALNSSSRQTVIPATFSGVAEYLRLGVTARE